MKTQAAITTGFNRLQPRAAAAAIAPFALAVAILPFLAKGTPASTLSADLTFEIRPFCIIIPAAERTELRRRIPSANWPTHEFTTDVSQGVQFSTRQKLARYWAKDYDWRKIEERLNGLPQFAAKIDGLDIHFIHVRSKDADTSPLILTYGWSGSIIEELNIIDALTNPTAHGVNASEAFNTGISSCSGYDFPSKPNHPCGSEIALAVARDLDAKIKLLLEQAQGANFPNANSANQTTSGKT